MKVSCIVTVYNLEKYIEEALQSIFRQTYKNYEVIVIDDCSTDHSAEIIAKYSGMLTYIKLPFNQGVLPAFLKGIEMSSGDILAFLDGDDIWNVNKLERIVELYSSHHDLQMVTHDYEYINSAGDKLSWNDKTQDIFNELAKKNLNQNIDEKIREHIVCYKGVWLGSAFTIRRSCFDLSDYKGFVKTIQHPELSHQDQPLAAFLVLYGKGKFGYLSEKLFKYRIHDNNTSGAAYDINKALRAVRRSLATVRATYQLVSRFPQLKQANKIQKDKIKGLEYLEFLYTGKYIKAINTYFYLFKNYWPFKESIKEGTRLFLYLVFGQKVFFYFKRMISKF